MKFKWKKTPISCLLWLIEMTYLLIFLKMLWLNYAAKYSDKDNRHHWLSRLPSIYSWLLGFPAEFWMIAWSSALDTLWSCCFTPGVVVIPLKGQWCWIMKNPFCINESSAVCKNVRWHSYTFVRAHWWIVDNFHVV